MSISTSGGDNGRDQDSGHFEAPRNRRTFPWAPVAMGLFILLVIYPFSMGPVVRIYGGFSFVSPGGNGYAFGVLNNPSDWKPAPALASFYTPMTYLFDKQPDLVDWFNVYLEKIWGVGMMCDVDDMPFLPDLMPVSASSPASAGS